MQFTVCSKFENGPQRLKVICICEYVSSSNLPKNEITYDYDIWVDKYEDKYLHSIESNEIENLKFRNNSYFCVILNNTSENDESSLHLTEKKNTDA